VTSVSPVSKDNKWHVLKNMKNDSKFKTVLYKSDPDLLKSDTNEYNYNI